MALVFWFAREVYLGLSTTRRYFTDHRVPSAHTGLARALLHARVFHENTLHNLPKAFSGHTGLPSKHFIMIPIVPHGGVTPKLCEHK